MTIDQTSEFKSDLKGLGKRYRTIYEDLESFERAVLIPFLTGQQISSNIAVKIEGFCGEMFDCYKVRKFACKALKGNGSKSGIRIIFIHTKFNNKITLIEMYYKGDKENEDKDRLKCQIKDLNQSK